MPYGPLVLRSGPWRGVRNTTDPFDTTPDLLQDALNVYFQGSGTTPRGFYQRPPFVNTTGISQSYINGLFSHIAQDGTTYNFCAAAGKLYRIAGDMSTVTDVTPVGVTIDSGATTRVFAVSYNNTLIVTDGVNRPWFGTNLSSTPITGTYIDIDGAGGAWTAYGKPTIFSGVLVFIAATVPNGSAVKARLGITWCEPGDQTTGYTQTNYTDFANIIQTSTHPLTAILGTNNGLYYWRDNEIGLAQGIVDGSFSSTATYAAVSTNIGTLSPASVDRFQNTIYFCDQFGRPQQLQIGFSVTEPQMWLQLQQEYESYQSYSASYSTSALALNCFGTVAPNVDVYVCTPWATSGNAGVDPPTSGSARQWAYGFMAATGTYIGRWVIGNGGRDIFAQGVFFDTKSIPRFVSGIFASAPAQYITYQSLPTASSFADTVALQTVTAKTGRLGYASDTVYDACETLTVLQNNAASTQVTVETPVESATILGSATPPTSQDGVYRVVVGMDNHAARGFQITVQPTFIGTLWGLQQIAFPAVAYKAGPEEI